MVQHNPNSVPGVGTTITAAPRKVLLTPDGAVFFPRGKIIAGAYSRDPGNTGDIDVLRAGMLMGKRTPDNKYAPSILGQLTVAGTAAGATITVAAAVGTELDRRVGAGGIFKVVGPPTDGGTVAVLNNLSYSSQTGGVITLATNTAVAEVQTNTLDALMTAGTYTLTYDGETTAPIAFDATSAEMQAALELLSTVSAGDITPEAANEPDTDLTQTFTFADTLGDVPMLSMDITNATGPTSSVFTETTKGELVGAATLGADAAIGSLLLPADGSEVPLALIIDEYGLKVTDIDNTTSIDIEFARMCIGGLVETDKIIQMTDEESTRAWMKAQMRLAGCQWVFDDDF
jgi:hypothetical protein